MVTALSLALALLASQAAPTPGSGGEPLPPGAPTDPYQLTAWCYGAMSEYLDIYDRVKPDLRDIDKMFGSSVRNEQNPYAADMAAAHDELKILAGAVEAAEKASPNSIAPQGAIAIKLGRSIWAPAELKTRRELARAWLSWGLPDRCDANARALAANSALLGQALKYNNPSAAPAPAPTAPAVTAPMAAGTIQSAPAPAGQSPPPEAPPAAPDQFDPNGPLPDSTAPHPQS